jgi:LysM repeat protein
MQVHTAYGTGEVIERDSVRGRTQLLVAGYGFKVWVDESDVRTASGTSEALPDDTVDDVDEDNSVTLPYNPDPQVSADITADHSSILPGEYEIDRDDRLHPADSLSFDERSEDEGPGPDSKLFVGPRPWEREAAEHFKPWTADDWDAAENYDPTDAYRNHPDSWSHQPTEADYADWEARNGKGKQAYVEDIDLGPKYIKLPKTADRNDPVVRFREDPYGEIVRHGSANYEISPAMEEYGQLIEADRSMRYAAWADVRRKAKRLRTEGQIDVKDLGDDRIYARVKGDHGVYDVMVKKGHEFGGIGRGHSVADYSCNCQWGRWAFKRQYKFVGRMCSHALAAYNEMQSQYLKDNHAEHFRKRTAAITAGVVQDFKDWADSVGADEDIDAASEFIEDHPEIDDEDVDTLFDHIADIEPERREVRDYTDPLGDWADSLDSVVDHLDPDLIFPAEEDEGDRSEFVSLDDDRKTTGPDQIVANYRYADQKDDLYNLYGLDAPESTGLKENPFADGGYDISKIPGVTGGPNTTAPEDPTGGLLTNTLTQSPSNTGAPGAPGSGGPGGSSANSGSSDPDSFGDGGPGNSTPPIGTGTGSGAGAGASAAGGSGWSSNDIAPDSIKPGDYEVKSGDTLAEIAQGAGYGDNYQALGDSLGIKNYDDIKAGDHYTIPTAPGASPAGGTDTATPGGTDTTTTSPEVTSPDPAGLGADSPPPSPGLDTSAPTSTPSAPLAAEAPTVDMTPAATPSAPVSGDPAALTSDPRVGNRYLYASDFEEDPAWMRYAADAVSTDPAEPASNPSSASTEDQEKSQQAPAPTTTDPKKDPADPASQGSSLGGGGFDASSFMDMAGPVIGGISSAAMPIAEGIGSVVSSGLGSIFGARYASMRTADLLQELRDMSSEPVKDSFGSMAERNEEVSHLVEQLRARGYDVSQFVANRRTAQFPDEADPPLPKRLAPVPKKIWETSEHYVDENERERFVDVTDGDGDITKPLKGKDKPQQKASRRRRMSKVAGRHFTLAEQRELEDEEHPLGARNKPTKSDLKGTHYLQD